jgi:2-polyprenyl-3-methyl-5-hydroxy-6-metoxy-1,4-benzoquinol methylase
VIGCQSLVDVGCGDWNWFSQAAFDFDYTGIDVVPDVIEANRRHERAGVRFAVVNAIEEPIPTADFALCREVLFHLSFAHARAVVANVKRAARYFAATTDLDLWFNSDIQTGDFRRINLLRRPYRFPPPLCLVDDSRLVPGRRLAVWETASLP